MTAGYHKSLVTDYTAVAAAWAFKKKKKASEQWKRQNKFLTLREITIISWSCIYTPHVQVTGPGCILDKQHILSSVWVGRKQKGHLAQNDLFWRRTDVRTFCPGCASANTIHISKKINTVYLFTRLCSSNGWLYQCTRLKMKMSDEMRWDEMVTTTHS